MQYTASTSNSKVHNCILFHTVLKNANKNESNLKHDYASCVYWHSRESARHLFTQASVAESRKDKASECFPWLGSLLGHSKRRVLGHLGSTDTSSSLSSSLSS